LIFLVSRTRVRARETKKISARLVGTPEVVAKALLEYYKLGATSLLIRGYDPRPDAVQYGEELIPRVRELVADYDAASSAAA
jgi:alkanesulfonate monooxygenase